jgi:hypothetical protein
MVLAPGARIGVYEVVSPIGSGGPAFAREASFGGSTVAQARIWL